MSAKTIEEVFHSNFTGNNEVKSVAVSVAGTVLKQEVVTHDLCFLQFKLLFVVCSHVSVAVCKKVPLFNVDTVYMYLYAGFVTLLYFQLIFLTLNDSLNDVFEVKLYFMEQKMKN